MIRRASIVHPFGNGVINLGYGQNYAGRINYGEIRITTPGNPAGTGELVSVYNQTTIHRFSGGFSAPFRSNSKADTYWSVGARFNYNYLRSVQENISASDWSATGYDFQLGLHYDSPDLKFSLSYQSQTELSGESDVDVQTHDDEYYSGIFFSSYEGGIPESYAFGALIGEESGFRTSLNVRLYDMDTVPVNEEWNISASASFINSFDAGYTGSFGAHVESRNHLFSSIANRSSTVFLTAGVIVPLQSVQLELAIADSHLTGNDERKQFFSRLGVGIQL